MTLLLQRQSLFWVIGLTTTTLLILIWGLWGRAPHLVFDDAYITYRYADHLRQGLGLVYNPGEWVLGTTAPLFAILLGLLGLFISDLEWLGYYLGLLAWLATAWMALALFWQMKRPFTALIAALFIALQPSLLTSLGMETPILIALMLSSAWAWLAGHKKLAVFLLAALILTRQDGALWAFCLGLEIWRRERVLPWREGLATSLLLSPWLLYAHWRYGSFLPNSASAKIGQTDLMPLANQRSFIGELAEIWQQAYTQLGLLLILLLLGAALIYIWRKAPEWGWLAGWLLAYLLIYEGLNVVNFPWYFTPPLTIATLLVAIPLGYALGDSPISTSSENNLTQRRRGAEKNREKQRFSFVYSSSHQSADAQWGKIPMIAALIAFSFLAIGGGRQLIQIGQTAVPGYNAAYRPAALWLAQNSPPEAQIAAIEIGVLGYLSQRPILDTMGLVTPEMTNHLVGWRETLVYTSRTLWPDYAIIVPNTAWDWVIDQWWFYEFYQPVANFDGVVIYQQTAQPIWSDTIPAAATFAEFDLTAIHLATTQITPGQQLDTAVTLTVHQTPPAAYQLTTYLIDNQTNERLAITSTFPFSGGYNSDRWQPGDELTIPNRLQLPPDLAAGSYRLGLLFYDPTTGQPVPYQQAADPHYPEWVAGWLRWGEPSSPTAVLPPLPLSQLESASWQNGIHLAGAATPTQIAPAANELPLQLTWYTDQPLTRNLTLFVHLLDETGTLVAQQDRPPFHGRFPTPTWQPHEQLTDQLIIPLPADIAPGLYTVQLGFYDENGRIPLRHDDQTAWTLIHQLQIAPTDEAD